MTVVRGTHTGQNIVTCVHENLDPPPVKPIRQESIYKKMVCLLSSQIDRIPYHSQTRLSVWCFSGRGDSCIQFVQAAIHPGITNAIQETDAAVVKQAICSGHHNLSMMVSLLQEIKCKF